MMKNRVKAILRILSSAMLLAVSGCLWSCGGPVSKTDWRPHESDPSVEISTLSVKAVEHMPREMILGMDASCVPALEAGGVKYYDHEGVEKDVYKILHENGINYIRVRVWNHPFDEEGHGYGGGNCDLKNAVAVGKRATEYGMKLLVNFHYSDFWADPAKQTAPLAWQSMSYEEKKTALYEYTKESLETLVSEGIEIGMVQVGNETNGAMCGERADEVGGWERIAGLMSAGAAAVREVCPKALVVLHFTNPELPGRYGNYAEKLALYQVDYDVFASSYYPYWHGTQENLASQLSFVAETYGKKTMIAETSYAYTPDDTDFYRNTIGAGGEVYGYPMTEAGQAAFVRDLTDTAVNRIEGCIGVFYWEGSWIAAGGKSYRENLTLWETYGSGWASSYAASYDPEDAGRWYGGCAVDNQAFFDEKGRATEALKVFALMRGRTE